MHVEERLELKSNTLFRRGTLFNTNERNDVSPETVLGNARSKCVVVRTIAVTDTVVDWCGAGGERRGRGKRMAQEPGSPDDCKWGYYQIERGRGAKGMVGRHAGELACQRSYHDHTGPDTHQT